QVDIAGDDALEVRLRLVEIVLAAPEGVVGVETDHGDAAAIAGVRGGGHPRSLRGAQPRVHSRKTKGGRSRPSCHAASLSSCCFLACPAACFLPWCRAYFSSHRRRCNGGEETAGGTAVRTGPPTITAL